MKRRKFILGTGAAAAGGASLLGSGAFSSVEADRSIDVDVVGDGEAFLRLAPCTIDGSEHPNGAYVRETPDGTIAIDLSDGNDQVAGDGVNAEALSVFHNVFEICNQGTQDVCVDFELDVPEIPGPVPDRFDFEAGDPAVVFYRGSNREEYISTDGLDVDRAGAISLSIEGGECECVGFEVRAFGFDAGAELFADAELTIRAEAGADCEDGVADPEPDPPAGFRITQNGEPLGPGCVEPIGGETGVAEYYDWDNPDEYGEEGKYSARPEVRPDDSVGHVFLYRDDGGDLYLVMVHGSPDSNAQNTYGLDGFPESGSWVVKDDDPEVYQGIVDSYGTDEVTWRWSDPRTDGGAYGPLEGCPDVDVTITPPDGGIDGIEQWRFISGDGQEFDLGQGLSLTIDCECDGSGGDLPPGEPS